MRITDVHVHTDSDNPDPAALVAEMDRTGIARTLVISLQERTSLERTRRNLEATRDLCAAAPGRLDGLAWIQPTLEGAAELAEEALTSMGFVGLKLMPDHWYPYEERLDPFWASMDRLGASILFHTGILYANEDSSRFCRPVYLEKLYHYPRIRFAMAHISWPWCEECLAVMGRMRSAASRSEDIQWQSYIDLTPGTPPHIRKQAVANAIEFCGVERIMFGTDCRTSNLARQKGFVERDLALFDELGLSVSQQERIMSGSADELFAPRK